MLSYILQYRFIYIQALSSKKACKYGILADIIWINKAWNYNFINKSIIIPNLY